ncbi:hypothetical protein MCA1771 [Methylococcus capsulatus str. Bath]|uniref:Uncharacterized protein n=1 Tax=Methylococcus capsulatus (strain ATCC 33009 / NCIMB 11132 / Bath) TaxID=243233 RepID=Q607I9_METCA|nr:hypothetical protein MCA1771 [Methylococcus capsulatus str. Bath]
MPRPPPPPRLPDERLDGSETAPAGVKSRRSLSPDRTFGSRPASAGVSPTVPLRPMPDRGRSASTRRLRSRGDPVPSAENRARSGGVNGKVPVIPCMASTWIKRHTDSGKRYR